jgi:hypothetical protein
VVARTFRRCRKCTRSPSRSIMPGRSLSGRAPQ